MNKYFINDVRMTAIMVIFFLNQPINAQWPQWRGQLRDGSSAETNLLKEWPTNGPRLIWTSDTVADGFSSAIIHNKVIYTTGTRDSVEILTALDFTGKLIWQQKIGKADKGDWPQSYSTPTVYKGKLYTVTVLGQLSCVDSKTGTLEWKINIPQKLEGIGNGSNGELFCESPLVVDDKVIITPCGKNTTMVAMNYANAEMIWKSESLSDSAFFVSPVLILGKDKKLIVTCAKNHLFAVDLNTGKIVWSEKTSSPYFYIPLPADKRVYFSNQKGNGKMLTISDDLSNFNFKWSDTLAVSPMGGTVKLGSQIYGTFTNSKGLFCMDGETGKIVSVNKEFSSANLIVADGMIYGYEDRTGRVFLIRSNGKNIDLVSSFKVKEGNGPHLAHMSIANGTLFIRHGKCLMAYDVKQQ